MTQVKLSGKKMLNKNVKSIDGKDLGKIQNITPDYVELKHGSSHYFIPKLHIKEFDKEDLYVLQTKDEIKDKYERDDPPLKSEIQEGEQSGKGHAGYHEVIPFMAKEPDLQFKGKESGEILTIPWEDVIHKHGRDEGHAEAVIDHLHERVQRCAHHCCLGAKLRPVAGSEGM